MKSFDEYNAREQQLVQFNKWADHEGLSLRMSGEFDHSNKDTHMAYLGYVEGQQSKQAEVDELQKRVKELELINFDSELHFDAAKEHIDHLQKKIDDCIKAMDDSICDIDCGTIYGILTGDQS